MEQYFQKQKEIGYTRFVYAIVTDDGINEDGSGHQHLEVKNIEISDLYTLQQLELVRYAGDGVIPIFKIKE